MAIADPKLMDIELVRRQLLSPTFDPRLSFDPQLSKETIERLKRAGEALREGLSPSRTPPLPIAGERDVEQWLTGIKSSLADARMAAGDWMSITALQESLSQQIAEIDLRLQALQGEELPALLFQQSQMDQQLEAIDLLAANAKAQNDFYVRGVNAIVDGDAAAMKAQGVLTMAANTRTPPLPSSAAYHDFDNDNRPLEGAVEASRRLTQQLRNENRFRDEAAAAAAENEKEVLKLNRQSVLSASENITALRASAETRRVNLVKQRDRLQGRLSGYALNFEQRIAGIISRYLAATNDLRERCKRFSDSMRRVYSQAYRDSYLKALNEAATFGENDRGAALDGVELALRPVQDWLVAIGTLSRRRTLAEFVNVEKEAESPHYRFSVSFAVPQNDSRGQLARVRAIRLWCPTSAPAEPFSVRVRAPERSQIKLSADRVETITLSAPRVAENGSVLLQPPVSSADGLWGTRELWNLSPYSENEWPWEIELHAIIAGRAPPSLGLLLELVVDQVDVPLPGIP